MRIINVVIGGNSNGNTIDYSPSIEETKTGTLYVSLANAPNLPTYNECENIDGIQLDLDGQMILCTKNKTNLLESYADNINYVSVGSTSANIEGTFGIVAYCISITPSNEAYFWLLEGGVENAFD